MIKINRDEVHNADKFFIQGGSWSTLYNGHYDGKDVVIKVQDPGSLDKTNNSDDRFVQELEILKLGLPGVVTCYGYGDDWDGERFIVLEKLSPPQTFGDLGALQSSMQDVIVTSRQLYLRGFNWTWNIHHILFDEEGNTKLIDFNDDDAYSVKESFFTRDSSVNILNFIEKMCEFHGHQNSTKEVIKHTFDYLVQEEYKSLENAHDPVYFEGYENLLRTETESNDPMYGKLVKANRNCHDRAKMIKEALSGVTGTSLDVGCNTGWTPFLMNDLGLSAGGVDSDDTPGKHRPKNWQNGTGGKIEFARLMADYNNIDVGFDFGLVTLEYVQNLKTYDVISALSILHLFLEWPKHTLGMETISREYWLDLFTTLAKKANKVFIFEVPDRIMPMLGFADRQAFYVFIKEVCSFKEVSVKGITDNGRPLVVCYRDIVSPIDGKKHPTLDSGGWLKTSKKEAIRHFTSHQNSNYFEQYADRFTRLALESIKREYSNGLDIIEVGPGIGNFGLWLFDHTSLNINSYTILDGPFTISHPKDYLKEHLSGEDFNKVYFIVSDDYKQIFNKKYDLLISNQCLSETPKFYSKEILEKIDCELFFIIDEGGIEEVKNKKLDTTFATYINDFFEGGKQIYDSKKLDMSMYGSGTQVAFFGSRSHKIV